MACASVPVAQSPSKGKLPRWHTKCNVGRPEIFQMKLKKIAAHFGMLSLFATVAGCAAEPSNDDEASASGPLVENVEAQNSALAIPCQTDFCVWWGQNFDGAVIGWNDIQVNDHSAYRYPNNGTGGGEIVGNNGGSFVNGRWDYSYTVYYNPAVNGKRPSGPWLHVEPNGRKNCAQAGPNICNNNRSHFRNDV